MSLARVYLDIMDMVIMWAVLSYHGQFIFYTGVPSLEIVEFSRKRRKIYD